MSWRNCVIIFQSILTKHDVIFESIFKPIFLPCTHRHVPSVWKRPALAIGVLFLQTFLLLKISKDIIWTAFKDYFSCSVPLKYQFLLDFYALFVHCADTKETSLKKYFVIACRYCLNLRRLVNSHKPVFHHFLEIRHMIALFFQNSSVFRSPLLCCCICGCGSGQSCSC